MGVEFARELVLVLLTVGGCGNFTWRWRCVALGVHCKA